MTAAEGWHGVNVFTCDACGQLTRRDGEEHIDDSGSYCDPCHQFQLTYPIEWEYGARRPIVWGVVLRATNGRLKRWVGKAESWDEAAVLAEAENPKYVAHTIGTYVPGSEI